MCIPGHNQPTGGETTGGFGGTQDGRTPNELLNNSNRDFQVQVSHGFIRDEEQRLKSPIESRKQWFSNCILFHEMTSKSIKNHQRGRQNQNRQNRLKNHQRWDPFSHSLVFATPPTVFTHFRPSPSSENLCFCNWFLIGFRKSIKNHQGSGKSENRSKHIIF